MHFRNESQKHDFIRAMNAAQVALEDDNAEAAYDIVYGTILIMEGNRTAETNEKLRKAKHAKRV